MMGQYFYSSLVCLIALCLFSLPSHADQKIDRLCALVEQTLEKKDISAYLEAFSPNQRQKEKNVISHLINRLELEKVTVFQTGRSEKIKEGTRTYIKVLLESPHAARIEVWKLDLRNVDGRFQIEDKEVTSKFGNLYKIRIPSGREKKARYVEIKQADIKLTFQNAMVFYDNIPGIETALLVIGDGQLLFSPSVERERHQLELVFNKKVLKDKLKYVYLRFSNSYFESIVRIEEDSPNSEPITETDRNKAYSLFAKHYSRSFTTENSLSGDLFSILPKDKETVLEFEGKKTGRFTYIYSPFSREEVTLYQWENKRFLNLYSPQIEGEKRKLYISFGEKFRVRNYQLDVDFDPREFYISGKAKIDIESRITALGEVKLKMNPDLEILRINDENKNTLVFSKDKLRSSLYVYFFRPITKGQTTFIEIYYRGRIKPPKITRDVLSRFQYENAIRMPPFRFETYLYSLSSYWYPHPPDGDYFTARAKIIIPPEYTVVSNGKLMGMSRLRQTERVEELDKVGCKVFTFESIKPVKYLSFIVGRFEKEEEDEKPVPLYYFRTPETRLVRWEPFDEAKRILRFYEKKFGLFPYEKLSIVHRVWRERGGHSPASFVVLNQLPRIRGGRRLVSAESPVNLIRWNEYFLAHEIAHQWWGQGVSWKSYHDLWISEGLAQFSTILYLKEKYGDEVFSDILKKFSKWTKKKSKWGPIILGSRLSYFDFLAFQTIIYNKTALILNMLKDMLGEEMFFRGLKEFYSNYRYGSARTKDFIHILSNLSPQNLELFFDGWFESYSLPNVHVERSVKKDETGYLLEINIVQIGKIFVFPLWMEWSVDGGKIKKMMLIDKRRQKFEFVYDTKPKRIKINPDNAVPGEFH